MPDGIRISWQEYHRNISALGRKIKRSGFVPDVIVCISRGGLPVGLMLSEYLKRPLAVITVQSYQNKKRGRLRFDTRISSVEPVKGKILLADDLVDSGTTMRVTKRYLQKKGKVKTAVMFRKECSSFEPDYFVKWMPRDKWIYFPYDLRG
ncbi:MAG: phosphoribosyltransferase family protein [Candidatus Micrarchaeota archaeon]|nr:phosphoribosyltransferase family protein [Candidatus Micrarchaeota archaeon]